MGKYKRVQPRKQKVAIDSLLNLVQYRKQIINPNAAKEEIAKSLLREGERIIKLAHATRGFHDRTMNLKDSYVAAVFVDGSLYGKAFVTKEESSEEDDPKTGTRGREEAEEFIEKVQSTLPQHGIRLVIGAAMYYSGIVESRGFVVLQQVEADIEDLVRNGFSGDKYLAHIKLTEFSEPSIFREWHKGQGLGDMEIRTGTKK